MQLLAFLGTPLSMVLTAAGTSLGGNREYPDFSGSARFSLFLQPLPGLLIFLTEPNPGESRQERQAEGEN